MRTSSCYSTARVYVVAFSLFLLPLLSLIPVRTLVESITSGTVAAGVVDSSCAVVPGVTVALSNLGAEAARIGVTGVNGTYVLVFLEHGNFTVGGSNSENCSIVQQAEGAEAWSGNLANSINFTYQGGMDRCVRLAASAHCKSNLNMG